jgi:dTDP-4-amino-4,6-dideoxygalactose transaminase
MFHREEGDLEMIKISEVHLGGEEEELVLQVLRSGHLAQGPMVEMLEAEFARAHDSEFAVAVNNGTTALVAAMQAIDLRPGDEVITSPFSFVATLNSILEAGATVRFADIGDDFCMDAATVEALIGPSTRVIMPVHLYGLPADMDAISSVAVQHGIGIVEDAAQAHGARIGDRSVGTYGVGCFSLYATKNIMSGEGGVITTSDHAIADRLRLLRNQGMRARYQYEIPGHNYRMTDLQAAIAIPQMHRLSEITRLRQANAQLLAERVGELPGLMLPSVPAGRSHVFHQFTVRLGKDAPLTRDEFAARLEQAGISTGIYYPRLMHDYDCYRSDPRVIVDHTPRAESIAQEVLSLPIHQYLSSDDIGRIADEIRELWR